MQAANRRRLSWKTLYFRYNGKSEPGTTAKAAKGRRGCCSIPAFPGRYAINLRRTLSDFDLEVSEATVVRRIVAASSLSTKV